MTDNYRIRYQAVIKVVLWVIVIGVGVLMYMYWNDIPSIVGIHLNVNGQVDDFGEKGMLIFFWLMTIVFNLLYTFNYQFNYARGSKSLYKRYPYMYHFMAIGGVLAMSIFLVARILGK